MKLVLITKPAELDAMATRIVASIKGLDTEVHVYLLSEIQHIEKHRNVTRLNKFFSALKGSGYRVNAMHAFVQVFGNFKLAKTPAPHKDPNGTEWLELYTMNPERKSWSYRDEKGKFHQVKAFSELLSAAESTEFWKFKPEPEVQEYKLETRFAGLIKAAIGQLDKAKGNVKVAEKTSIDAAFLAELVDLARKHGIKQDDMVPSELALPEDVQKSIHLIVDNTVVPAENPIASAPAEKPAPARRGRKAANVA